jgi:hypothetical protein
MERALEDVAAEVNRHRADAPPQISVRMIQAYAMRKNHRG